MNEIPAAVAVLWWIAIGVVVAVIVPALLLYLHRTLEAARTIQIYTRDTLKAAENTGRNLDCATMLADQLAELAPPSAGPEGESE